MGARSRQQWLAAAMGLLMSLGFVGTTAAAEIAFKENCAKCHARPTSVARSVQGNSEQERRKALDLLLRSHHAENPKLRAEIVDYLVGLSGQ
jgi:hypothetical protein